MGSVLIWVIVALVVIGLLISREPILKSKQAVIRMRARWVKKGDNASSLCWFCNPIFKKGFVTRDCGVFKRRAIGYAPHQYEPHLRIPGHRDQ